MDDDRVMMDAIEGRWLACAANMAAAGKRAAQPLYGTAAGRVSLGQGAGGDRTIQIDYACETAMREVLDAEAPARYLLVSEELGELGPADAPWRVVVDPLDGSLNAKRGLEPFCSSVAVADGSLMRDVTVAHIEDYTRPRTFAAVRGSGLVSLVPKGSEAGSSESRDQGALVPGFSALQLCPDPSRVASELVEVVLLEAGRPDRHGFRFHDLSEMGALGRSQDLRVRQIGSLALSLCHLAMGVADILVAPVRTRSVDIAAGLLILKEAGGGDIQVVVGGIIPPKDYEQLYQAGVACIFGPGTPVTESANQVLNALERAK